MPGSWCRPGRSGIPHSARPTRIRTGRTPRRTRRCRPRIRVRAGAIPAAAVAVDRVAVVAGLAALEDAVPARLREVRDRRRREALIEHGLEVALQLLRAQPPHHGRAGERLDQGGESHAALQTWAGRPSRPHLRPAPGRLHLHRGRGTAAREGDLATAQLEAILRGRRASRDERIPDHDEDAARAERKPWLSPRPGQRGSQERDHGECSENDQQAAAHRWTS